MPIKLFLKTQKKAILQDWLERTIATYPEESRPFLLNKHDRFANPVGANIAEGLECIFDGLLHDLSPDEIIKPLDNIIRIRAVQEFSPSAAISFIYLLKDVAKKALVNEIKDKLFLDGFLEYQAQIDSLALLAFDTYMKCREDLFEIRVGELKRRIPVFMRQFN
jgi:hypothetical protein